MSEEIHNNLAFARQLGVVEGRLSALEQKLVHLEQRIEGRLMAIDGKLDQLTAVLNIGRGGWKVLAVLGAALMSGAALLGWLYDHWWRP